jgi:hypothetical protein
MMSYRRKKKGAKPYVIKEEHGESDEHFALRKEYISSKWKNAEEKRRILAKLKEIEEKDEKGGIL